ncbi:hypothetical protein [Neobacillus sp. YIM B06451]|uniref:hypothetical protein n=1 Tax=Neobacillus sp. YIM B06451 TaxID=3070994 RepID=UPI00292F733D|nr:hypothetical protein [Neobacillus sp. YIM B06451]
MLAVVLATFAGAILFSSKIYYPPLPIQQMSKKEVIEKANGMDGQIVRLSTENNYAWYILRGRNMETADQAIIELVNRYGWTYFQKEGSGLFFEKQGDTLILTTQKWTRDYTLVKIPVRFDK